MNKLPQGLTHTRPAGLGPAPSVLGVQYTNEQKTSATKPEHKGWFSNLVDQAINFGPGVAAGIGELAKTSYSDLDKLVGGYLPGHVKHAIPFTTMAKAAWTDTSNRWAPLFHGDFKAFQHQLATRPLDFLLDASLVIPEVGEVAKAGAALKVAGGARAAARAGHVTVAAAEPSLILRMAGYVPRTAEAAADAAKVYGPLSKEFLAGQHLGVVRDVRRIGGHAADERFANVSEVVGKPATLLKPIDTNFVRRARNTAVDKAFAHVPEKTPIIGLMAQESRQALYPIRLADDVRRAQMLSEPKKALRAVRTGNEQIAWWLLHQKLSPKRYADHLEQQMRRKNITNTDRGYAKVMRDRVLDPEVQKLVNSPTKSMLKAVDKTQNLANNDMGALMQELGFTDFQLLQRRLLTQHVLENAKVVTKHPQTRKVLRGAKDAAGVPYHDREMVNPATGNLFRDDLLRMSPEDRALLEQTAGSYTPHLEPEANMSRGTRVSKSGMTMSEPLGPKHARTASIGARFSTGAVSTDPEMLLRTASGLAKSATARDRYNVMMLRGLDFDPALFRKYGGSRDWVLMDGNMYRSWTKKITEHEGMIQELEPLISSDAHAEMLQTAIDARATTEQLALEAKKNGGQTLKMIPRSFAEAMTKDMKESSAAARWLIDKPLDVFRSLVLFLRPAYYVNNIVGQNLVLAVKEGGPGFVPKYIRWLAANGAQGPRNLPGARALFREQVTAADGGMRGWMAVVRDFFPEGKGGSFADVSTSSGTFSGVDRWRMSTSRLKRGIGAMLQTPGGLARVGGYLSDDLVRQFRFIRLMEPHVRNARLHGIPGNDAQVAQHLLENDPVLRERLVQQTLSDLIDYRHMSDFERRQMRRVVPFYGWLRGIGEWTARLGYDEPRKLYALAQISGEGQRANADWSAVVPRWLSGAIRIGDQHNGQQRVITTQGLNPFSTLSDLAIMGQAAVSGDPTKSLAGSTSLATINPYAKSAFAAFFNQGKELGQPFQMLMPGQTMNAKSIGVKNQLWPSNLGTALGGFLATTPPAMLYQQHKAQGINERIGAGSVVNSTGVYRSPWSDYLLSYFGIPTRNVDLAGAQAKLARDTKTLAGEGSSF